MSFADVGKRIQPSDARLASPSPPPPRRCRLLACLVVLVTLLVGFSISQSSICGRLTTTSILREGAAVTHGGASGGSASDVTPSDWLANRSDLEGLDTKFPTAKRHANTISSAPAPAKTILECLQVAQPVLTPHGATYASSVYDNSSGAVQAEDGSLVKESCTVVLMEHTFAWSYGDPFIGNYTPPSCQFNRVVMNFTVRSQGRQFDRLALMYFGDTEVWRTSTAEPTPPPGIRWVYLKDMTHYLYFWKSPQKIIFDLGNLVDDKYTGLWSTTLTATFFVDEAEPDSEPPSDLIIPISKRQGAADAISQFTLPEDEAINTFEFPRNARRAVFSVSACGQATEEFWWSNVPQTDVYTFNSTAGDFPGFSPFREVQVLIDGQIAGVQWPFPVIFTGGVVPGLHRPIVGIDAFDLREHEIDITPFLPLLCDGADHTFAIRVAGLDNDSHHGAKSSGVTLTKTVGDSWYVTGKIFVWLDDDPESVTTGDLPTIEETPPVITVTRQLGQTRNGTNETLAYTTNVKRTFNTKGRIVTQTSKRAVSWSQTLSYSNKGYISDFGNNQLNDLILEGTDRSSSGPTPYRADYSYPLFANTTSFVSPLGNLTLKAHLVQGLRLHVQGPSVYPTGLEAFPTSHGGGGGGRGSLLDTTKEGTASFFQTGDGKNSTGFGSSDQVLRFLRVGEDYDDDDDDDDDGTELFFRDISAVNSTIVYDRVRLDGRAISHADHGGRPEETGPDTEFAAAPPGGGGKGPRVFMGRMGALGGR